MKRDKPESFHVPASAALTAHGENTGSSPVGSAIYRGTCVVVVQQMRWRTRLRLRQFRAPSRTAATILLKATLKFAESTAKFSGSREMASLEEIKQAIGRLKEKPEAFDQFVRRYPDWEGWKRTPYGAKRVEVETLLVEEGVLEKSHLVTAVHETRIEFPIKIPGDKMSTLTGNAFTRAFSDKFYLFRRSARIYDGRAPILISSIDFDNGAPLNFIEKREGKGRTAPLRQIGVAYLTQGSLVLLADDECGHPCVASFAHVRPAEIKVSTPILDGHLLASTQEPDNANFVVRVMLVRARDRNAATGIFDEEDDALAEFRKQRPENWTEDRWTGAFNERFGPRAPLSLIGTYYQIFPSHRQFEA